jgi:hypothetical protein
MHSALRGLPQMILGYGSCWDMRRASQENRSFP